MKEKEPYVTPEIVVTQVSVANLLQTFSTQNRACVRDEIIDEQEDANAPFTF